MPPKKPRVVVAGSGFAGLKAAKRLEDRARVTLVSPTDRFTYLPLVHELVSEESRPNTITKPLRKMVKAKHVEARAEQVKGDALLTSEGEEVPFDHLVVAIGAEPHYFGVPGAAEHALPFWSLRDGLRANAELKERLLDPGAGEDDGHYRVIVVGAGPTGLEVATEAAAFFERYEAPYEVDVIEMRDRLFPGASKEFRDAVREGLERYNVRVLLRTAVKSVDPEKVTVQTKNEDARGIRSDLTFWCAGIRGRVLEPLSMKVDWTLRSVDRPDVFIVGDCARFPTPVPQLAQTAEQQGLVAAHNVLHPERMRKYEPKLKGQILSLGPNYAVAELANGAVLAGKLPWHVKKQYYKWSLRRG